VEDVAAVTFELKHFVVVFKVLETDRACVVHVERQVGVGDRLDLVHDVNSSHAPLSIASHLTDDQQDDVADEGPRDEAEHVQAESHHRYEVALVLPVDEKEPPHVLDELHSENAADSAD